MTPNFAQLLKPAFERRQPLLERLQSEGTDAYRLYHGTAEGFPGLTVDRYGTLILAQTFRDPLSPADLAELQEALHALLPFPFAFSYNHRGKKAQESFELWHTPEPPALEEIRCQEFGVHFLIRARHPGIDPWLFLDLRAGRRHLRPLVAGKTLLNLFSYTCSVGVTAAAAGASEVWNVDFASSSLSVGRRNAELNLPTPLSEKRFRTIEEDCLPVMRQLAGLPAGGRKPSRLQYQKFEPRLFDFVFLDPPAWSKGKFGAVDVAGDYPSLFKAAVLAARPNGGRVIATNHVPSVDLDGWLDVLKRCAAKAGRPIRSLQTLSPEEDFPSFDGRHPLKIAVCEL